jgi:hypothetical protein
MEMPEWVKRELRDNYAKASRAGRLAERRQPRASRVAYLARQAALRIELRNGVRLIVPIKLVPGLERASQQEIRSVEILGTGEVLHWEPLDLDLSVPLLVVSLFGGPEWMSELGRIGGRQKSAAKAAAARRNGRKGGRPRKAGNGVGSRS